MAKSRITRQVVPFSARQADQELLEKLSQAMGGAGATAVIRAALRDAAAQRLALGEPQPSSAAQ